MTTNPDVGERLNDLVSGVLQLLLTGGDIRSQATSLRDELAACLTAAPPHLAATRAANTANRLVGERRSRVRGVLLDLLEYVLEVLAFLETAPDVPPLPPTETSPLPAGLNLQGDRNDAQLLALLCRLGGESAVPLYRRTLREGNERLVLQAITDLPKSFSADEVEEACRLLLDHASTKVRNAAAGCLVSLVGSEVSRLVELLDDEDERVRTAAANALARLGPRASETVPALVEALQDRPAVRLAAVLALTAIGPKAREAGPVAV